MHELITKLTEKAGISPDQAQKALDTIKDFVKEKFPMMAGAVDNLFPETGETAAPSMHADATPANDNGSMLDKISDVIPGGIGQKAEDFAKDHLGGFFGGDKK
ncbi:MAG: hypothetical protein JWQ27_1300 [Ferruginibacter sp.]|nr:hypothetical protein [Ferruginibacter sp.]